jgi:hypothetical protein
MFYVVAVKPPTYEAKASVLLVNPPSPPTAAQIQSDPSLAHIHSNNPFVGLGNLVLVADVVIEVVSSSSSQLELVQQGANPSYTVALDVSQESPPAIDITGTGSTSAAAIQSAKLVATSVSQNLYQMQAAQGINTAYMISSIEYVKPTSAISSSSGKLRALIEVTILGLIILLVAVSISQGLEERKNKKPGQRGVSAHEGDHAQVPSNASGAEMYDEYQWPAKPLDEPRPTAPSHRPDPRLMTRGDQWNRRG